MIDNLDQVTKKSLNDFFEHNLDIMFAIDYAGNFVKVNNAWRDTLGYSLDDLKDISVLDLVHPDYRDFVSNFIVNIKDSKNNFISDIKCKTKSGMYRSFECKVDLINDIYFISAHDISSLTETKNLLKESEKLLDMFFDNSNDGFFFMMLDEPILWNDCVDKDELMDYVFYHQRVTRVNKAMADQYNCSEEDLIGTTPADFYLNNINRGKKLWRKLFDNGRLHIDGTIPSHFSKNVLIKGDYICLYDDSGRITGHLAVQRDVTCEKVAQTIIVKREMRFSQLAENIEEIFWIREGDYMIYVNSAFERVTGISVEDVKKRPSLAYEIVIDEDMKKIFKALNKSPNKFNMRYRIRKPDGEMKWIWERGSTFKCPITNVIRTVGVSADITHMKQLEEKLERISSIDELTQIYSRKYVFDRLKDIVEDYIKNNTVFSFAILDIDFFKKVNDNYGHTTGDFILKEFARIIKDNIRSSDILGRYGGEEFVIVLKGTNKQDASHVVEDILDIIRNTIFEYDGARISFTFSGGISDALEFDPTDFNITQLVNLADERLYLAKNTGRNKIVIENEKLLKS